MTRPAQRPVRVCYLAIQAWPLIVGETEGFGGAELCLWNLAREAAKDLRFQVSLVCVTPEAEAAREMEGVRVVPVRGYVAGTPPPPKPVRLAGVALFSVRLARALASTRADIYFTKLPSLESLVCEWTARLRRKPFCFRLSHDWETSRADLTAHLFHGKSRRTAWHVASLQRAATVYCQSPYQQEALRREFGLRARRIGNAHRMPEVAPSPRAERTSIVWISRCHPMKRPLEFVEIARRMPERRFTLVMSPARGHEALFDSVVREAGALANVEFLPGVPHAEIDGLLRRAQAFVLTSDAEGVPNVLLEALKNGVPVVSVHLNPSGMLWAWPLAVGEGAVAAPGLFLGSRLEAAPDALKFLLEEGSERWEEFARCGVETMRRTHDVSNVIRLYKRRFLALAGRRGGARGF